MVKLFVARLDYSTTEKDLTAVFERFGRVQKIFIPTDKETGKPRGFAFVDVLSDNVDEIIAGTDGTNVNGREISVKIAEDKRSNDDRKRNFNEGHKRPDRNFQRPSYSNDNKTSQKRESDTGDIESPFLNPDREDDTLSTDAILKVDKTIKKKAKKGKNSSVDRSIDGNRKLKMNAYKKSGKNSFIDFDDEDDFEY